MKKIIFTLLFLTLSTTCFAESTFNGIYLGAGAGYESGDTKFVDGVTNANVKANFDSPTYNINLGLGHSILHFLYLGAGLRYEGFSDAKASGKNDNGESVELKNAYFVMLTPGLLITQRTLLYANLGAGEADVKYSQGSSVKSITPTSGPHNSWSGIYGIGLKQGLNDYVAIGAEYDHVAAGSAGLANNISSLGYNEASVNLTFYL